MTLTRYRDLRLPFRATGHSRSHSLTSAENMFLAAPLPTNYGSRGNRCERCGCKCTMALPQTHPESPNPKLSAKPKLEHKNWHKIFLKVGEALGRWRVLCSLKRGRSQLYPNPNQPCLSSFAIGMQYCSLVLLLSNRE